MKGVAFMIDKSIPYFDVVMVRPGHLPHVQAPDLPAGYSYHLYQPGDICRWTAVETAVDEFDEESQARAYFEKSFLPYEGELAQRMAFILDAEGQAVADATAWYAEDTALGRVALLHWVAADPRVQGKGLGRAVTCKALSLFAALGPQGDIWLTTQTWSHVAIGLYLSLGFCAHKTYEIAGHTNGYEGAAGVLQGIMPPAVYQQFVDTAIG